MGIDTIFQSRKGFDAAIECPKTRVALRVSFYGELVLIRFSTILGDAMPPVGKLGLGDVHASAIVRLKHRRLPAIKQ